MGNRITFDEICQQLCSIYRVTLCSFQNEVQNNSPYLVRYGQLESVFMGAIWSVLCCFVIALCLNRFAPILVGKKKKS